MATTEYMVHHYSPRGVGAWRRMGLDEILFFRTRAAAQQHVDDEAISGHEYEVIAIPWEA